MLFGICIICLAVSCKNTSAPDVSGIKLTINTERFDKDFFAIDTSKLENSIQVLQKKYPEFLTDFLYNILGLAPQKDSVEKSVPLFLLAYKNIQDSVDAHYKDFEKQFAVVETGLKYVHYYFPDYVLPKNIITFTGPVESYGSVLTSSGLAIGLQLYLGKDFPAYHTEYIEDIYPAYISRRFEPGYIPVNCMKNIISDMFVDSSIRLPLVQQMIEAGKRLYVLDRLLPQTADTLKTGYTANELDGCEKNENLIWAYFVQNDLLFVTDPSIIRDYMNDAPKTQALGEASPGFIGQFVGWKIVEKWMDENAKTSLQDLMETPAKKIYDEAKYKPR